MEIAKLVLAYLQVLLTGPPMVAIVSLYFLGSQKESIAELIRHTKKINLPGGGSLDTGYSSPDFQKGNGSQVLSDNKLDVLEQDFNEFIFDALQANRKILNDLSDVLWEKSVLGGPFRREKPSDFLEKAKMLNVDPNALEDIKEIEELNRKSTLSRKEAIQAYLKSTILIDYFRKRITRR